VANPENPEIFVEAFERLKEQGKIREYGISTNSVESLAALDAKGGCATCQMTYSILDRSPEQDILPYCLEHDIGVLLKGPLSKGILADKFSDKTVFEDSVRAPRWNADGTDRKNFLSLLAIVERLRPLVPEGASMVDLALAFVLANPAVTCPIPGMKNPEQARMNAAAAELELDADILARIDEIAPIQ
jgi:aryl-alcohol dehydrogenase-like predicted oxidoreductase